MDARKKSTLAVGVVLILLGAFFAAINLFPGLNLTIGSLWPLIIVAIGLALFVLGLVLGVPDLSVPACIVAGIGCILYYQDAIAHDYSSWSYIWALIPGFVGLGIILASLTGGKNRYSVREGLSVMLSSAVLFFIFGSFFGAFGALGVYWPLVLVAAGLLIIFRSLLHRK